MAYYLPWLSNATVATGIAPDDPVWLRVSGSLVGQIPLAFRKPDYRADGSVIAGDPVTATHLYRFGTKAAAKLGSLGSPSQTVNCGTASSGTLTGVPAGTYWVCAESANAGGQSYPSHPLQVVVT